MPCNGQARAGKAAQAGQRADDRIADHLRQAGVALQQMARRSGDGQQQGPLHGRQARRGPEPLGPDGHDFVHELYPGAHCTARWLASAVGRRATAGCSMQHAAGCRRRARTPESPRRSGRRPRPRRSSCPAWCRWRCAAGSRWCTRRTSPGLSSGCWPTTPRPFTSSISPAALAMIQWREISWAGHLAGIGDGDGVGEAVQTLRRRRLLGQVLGLDFDAELVLAPCAQSYPFGRPSCRDLRESRHEQNPPHRAFHPLGRLRPPGRGGERT